MEEKIESADKWTISDVEDAKRPPRASKLKGRGRAGVGAVRWSGAISPAARGLALLLVHRSLMGFELDDDHETLTTTATKSRLSLSLSPTSSFLSLYALALAKTVKNHRFSCKSNNAPLAVQHARVYTTFIW